MSQKIFNELVNDKINLIIDRALLDHAAIFDDEAQSARCYDNIKSAQDINNRTISEVLDNVGDSDERRNMQQTLTKMIQLQMNDLTEEKLIEAAESFSQGLTFSADKLTVVLAALKSRFSDMSTDIAPNSATVEHADTTKQLG